MARKAPIAVILAAVLALPVLILSIVYRIAGEAAGLRVGQEIPQARLKSLDGQFVDTRSWKGSRTLLMIFLPTCPACEREIRGLEVVAESLPEMRVVLLSANSQPPRIPTVFQVLSDPSGDFLRKVRRLMVPTFYLLDTQGKVQYVHSGQRDAGMEGEILRELLRRKPQESGGSGRIAQ